MFPLLTSSVPELRDVFQSSSAVSSPSTLHNEKVLQTNSIGSAATDDLNNAEKVPQEDAEGAFVGQNYEDDAGGNVDLQTAILNSFDDRIDAQLNYVDN